MSRPKIRFGPDPAAKDVPEISDEHEMKFVAGPNSPHVQRLAKRIGWEAVRALDES
jgi:hypothetical protein